LDGGLDLLELDNNGGELFLTELRGELNESLDWVALGDSAQGTFDFLLGDLEEGVSTSLEGLKFCNDCFKGTEGVLITDFSNGVGFGVVITSIINQLFSGVEESEL